MARIPQDAIERMKREVDLVELVRASGVQLKKQGANYLGLCPFHGDREPSLVVTPAKNLWNCLGACDRGGDAFAWVMQREACSFREAYTWLCRFSGVEPEAEREPEKIVVSEAERQELVQQVVDDYHQALKASKRALTYLEQRGIADAVAIEHFKLGTSNRSLSKRLPSRQSAEGAELRAKLSTLGIFRASGHEHFAGSLVIPVIDPNGIITDLYGRKVLDNLRPGTPLHTYLPGPHRGVWNLDGLTEADVILCESLIDALTFWIHGFHCVTASYGTQGFTEAHLQAFTQRGVRRVLIAYDADKAGNEAANKLAARLAASSIASYRVGFPKGMDANDFALKMSPAPKALGLLADRAAWMAGPQSAQTVAQITRGEIRSPSLEAQAKDPMPEPEIEPIQGEGYEARITLGDRTYRVRGLDQKQDATQLKVNLMVAREDRMHIDIVELYSAKQRTAFIHEAARELYLEEATLREDLRLLIGRLEAWRDRQAFAGEGTGNGSQLSEPESQEALVVLRDPNLLDRILEDFETCGIVGEKTNKLLGYLAAISRLLPDPLAIAIQSASSAGKTATMDAILSFTPPEEVEKYTAMTGKSLFYMDATHLKHKVLAIVEEEGAEGATYPLKLLVSEGELNIASTGKDPKTGKLTVERYQVEGPVALILTTTAIDMDEELRNRCIILTVDESRAQTRAIHLLQREAETLNGWRRQREREVIQHRHQNMQRLLRPIHVVNPYAHKLTFLDTKLRTRRDQKKYLALIRAIALLHQYQRPLKVDDQDGRKLPYIEATREDIAVANRLINATLGRCLDELTPQTRRFLDLLDEMVRQSAARDGQDRQDVRFTRREIREHCGWSDFQVRTHMDKLVTLEYVLAHRGRRGQSFVYELMYAGEGQDGNPFVMGLIDVKDLGSRIEDLGEEGGRNDQELSGLERVAKGDGSGGDDVSTRTQVSQDRTVRSHEPSAAGCRVRAG